MRWWFIIMGGLFAMFFVSLACFTGNKGVEQSPHQNNESTQAADTTQSAQAGGDVDQSNETTVDNDNNQSTNYNLPAWATVLLILGSQILDKLFRRFKPYCDLDHAIKGRNGTSSGNP